MVVRKTTAVDALHALRRGDKARANLILKRNVGLSPVFSDTVPPVRVRPKKKGAKPVVKTGGVRRGRIPIPGIKRGPLSKPTLAKKRPAISSLIRRRV